MAPRSPERHRTRGGGGRRTTRSVNVTGALPKRSFSGQQARVTVEADGFDSTGRDPMACQRRAASRQALVALFLTPVSAVPKDNRP